MIDKFLNYQTIDGQEYEVRYEIDWGKVSDRARRAARSKSLRSVTGPVTVSVIPSIRSANRDRA